MRAQLQLPGHHRETNTDNSEGAAFAKRSRYAPYIAGYIAQGMSRRSS